MGKNFKLSIPSRIFLHSRQIRNNFTHRKRTKLPRTKRNGERDGRKQLFAMQEASRPLDPSYISQVGIFRNF